ncbi:MAG: hypothetical protein E7677_02025 [Ruminococcaceae bacterium]|nr:hypothetical protein [Oscillospiraceae bacterium]
MKKAVIIIIVLIYVASVALVSFFGLQFKVFEEVIPVERIEITNEGQKHSETQGDYIVIHPDASGERRVKIDYHVYPENASNTNVDFAYQEVEGVTVDEHGLVTFSGPGLIKVRVIATDGSNTEDTLLIIAR